MYMHIISLTKPGEKAQSEMEELQIRSHRSHILLLLLSLLSWTLLPSISALRVNQRSLINDRTMPLELELDLNLSYTASGGGGGIGALFLFGDSLCDTGNGPFVNHRRATSLPFGMTFPGYAIGRFSDGRDIVPDFLGTTTLNLRQRQRQRQRQICLA